MSFSRLQPGLLIVAILVNLVTHAEASDLTVEAVNSRPAQAKVQIYQGNIPSISESIRHDSKSIGTTT